MKKIFSLFAAVLMAGSMMAADPVVLTFSDWGDTSLNKDGKVSNTAGDFSTAYTTTTLIDSLKGAAGFVTCSATSKCYAGRVGYGNKLGSSSAIGSFTLDLVNPAEFDSIVVRCSSYSATEGSLSINGGTAIDLTDGGASNKVLRDVKITPAGEVSSLSIATTAKRAYVKSITFYPHEVAPAPDYYLIGAGELFGNWNLSNAVLMPGGVKEVELAQGNYEFKVLPTNTSWNGELNASSINTTCSSANVRASGSNIHVSVASAGTTLRVEVVEG